MGEIVYGPGEQIFCREDDSDKLYFVNEGTIEIVL